MGIKQRENNIFVALTVQEITKKDWFEMRATRLK